MKQMYLLHRIMGTVFVLSALLKVASFASFMQETGVYMDAYFWTPTQWEIRVLAAGVCAAELILGLLSFIRSCMLWACTGLLALLTFFVGLTARNLFFPTLMGSVESCGCFGELIHFSPTGSFVKSVVLWVMALLLWAITIKKNHCKNIVIAN